MKRPETQYATTVDGYSIAYQAIGEGPMNVVMIPGIVSHVELNWESPAAVMAFERIGRIGRLLTFDKRGTGLSDHRIEAATLEQRLDDVTAAMDAAGMDEAAIYGSSEGGAMAILFAATYPERVTHLMLHGSVVVGVMRNERIGIDGRAEIADAIVRGIEEGWGKVGGTRFANVPPEEQESAARTERFAASPSTAAALMRMNLEVDVRGVLGAITVPTLVTHCSRDPVVPVWQGRLLADGIEGATFVEIDADWHNSHRPEEFTLVLDACERFLTGEVRAAEPDRFLATMLFTDIADSTATAAKLGDAEWRRRLETHDRVVLSNVAQWRGELVKNMGDGVLVTFDGPGRAIECARSIRAALAGDGLTIRAGVHTGEVERRGTDLAGLGVHIAARVQQAAAPGEILVSPTVPGLVAGAGFGFEDRGEHELKGVPGSWRLAAVK